MRRKYEETWTIDGSIVDAIAAERGRIEALSPRPARFIACQITTFAERHDGVQDAWMVTLVYEAED